MRSRAYANRVLGERCLEASGWFGMVVPVVQVVVDSLTVGVSSEARSYHGGGGTVFVGCQEEEVCSLSRSRKDICM